MKKKDNILGSLKTDFIFLPKKKSGPSVSQLFHVFLTPNAKVSFLKG